MIKIHNTLGRQVEDFKPVSEGKVTLYTCGPTVYSYYHVGNLRNGVFNDTLRRVLETSGYKVKHVMNITDVGHLTSDGDEGDDKLEKGAKAEGKTVWQVAEFYTEVFKKDMNALNILPPNGYKGEKDSYARATDFIDQQIEMIRLLLDKDFAYQTEQAIYFDVTKLDNYGELTGQKLADKEVGARTEVVTDKDKHHVQDFAVWFFAVGHFEGHSMHWSSPWGEGFPGWHLECSAIVHATLGEPIDIHTGAVDLIGTHHTNEIAQTQAAFGHQLANYWVHNEYVLIEGQKMSKSLGNIYRLEDITKKGYSSLALRLLFLQSHYRSQMNFTWESLEAAQNRLRAYQAFADLRFQHLPSAKLIDSQLLAKSQQEISIQLSDDLATPTALAALDQLIGQVGESEVNTGEGFGDFLKFLDNTLGLNLLSSQDITPNQKSIITDRERAREVKDWSKADDLRAKLLKQNLEINDTPNGPIWSRSKS